MKAGYFILDRAEMLPFIKNPIKKALDIGCGEGNFGKILKEQFMCDVWAFEPSDYAFPIAKEKLDHVFNKLFDATLISDNSFDLISFNDVLEHIIDPWETLRSCKSKLTKNGHIIASIPNILYFHDFFRMVFNRDWKYEEAGIFDRTHVRFFTKKSMIRLFEECGYEIISIEGIRPTDSKKFTLFNLATFGYWKECRYLQYAIYAKPRKP